MTIEERITNKFNSNFDDPSNPIKKSIVDDITSLVIKCCKEQQEIDIQRAFEWFRERICFGICTRPCARHMNGCGIENCIALNSIEQTMKGE